MKIKILICLIFISVFFSLVFYKNLNNHKNEDNYIENSVDVQQIDGKIEEIKIDKSGYSINKKNNEDLPIEDVTNGSATEKMILLQKEIEKNKNEIDNIEDNLFVLENEISEYNTIINKNIENKGQQQAILSQYAQDLFESENKYEKMLLLLKETSLKDLIFRYNNINEYYLCLSKNLLLTEKNTKELEQNKNELSVKQTLYDDYLKTINIKKDTLLKKELTLRNFLIQEQVTLFNESVSSTYLLKNKIFNSKYRYNNKYQLTMILPVNGVVTSEYGDRVHPLFGSIKHHSGVDIGVDYGTPVVASAEGIVVMSTWYGGYGKAIMLDHGNNINSLYGHNSQILVKEGDFVKQGQVIALAGSTGYSTGPHCHFEVRVNGDDVDPFTFVK